MSITPNVNQSNVVAFIVDTHTTWKSNRLNLEQLWKECFFRAYSRWPGGGMINQGSGSMEKYYHPTIENMVDTVTAQLVMAAMPSDSFFTVLSRNKESEAKADDANALLRWVHMKNKLKKELGIMIKQAVITGNAPWHCTWTVRKTSVPDQKKLGELETSIKADQDLGLQTSPLIIPTKPLVTYAGPDFFSSSIYDFVHDPWPEDEDRSMRMRRTFKSPDSVKAMGTKTESGYVVYENTDNITAANNTEASDTFKQQSKLAIGIAGDYEGKDKVEIIECYGDIPVTFGEDSETVILYNHIAVIANRSVLLRLEPLPFEHGMMPCGVYQLLPRPGEPYGAGLVERCLGLHDAILERFNQSIMAHAMAINPMWFYKPDALFEPDDFEAFPGALFPYSNEMPRPFEVPDRAMEGFQEVSLLKNEISEAAGSIMDMSPNGKRSATETSLVASMGNARFAHMVTNLEETTTMVVRQEISLLQQLLSDRIWIRVTHPSNPDQKPIAREIGREDILGEFDIYCVGASQMANNAQKIGMVIQTTGALASTPAAEAIDWISYGSELFEMQGLKDASSRFFKTQEQINAERQRKLAEQAALATAGGPGATPGSNAAPGMAGIGSLPGVPNAETSGAPDALLGMGDEASAPGRRPLGLA